MSEKKEQKKIAILDPNADPKRLIMALVWPMIIEEIMSILVNFVDTAMVGSLGVNATASTALGSSLIGLCNGVAIGLGTGFSVMMSRRIGEGRKDEALRCMQQSFYYIIGMGVLLTVLFSFVFADNLPRWMNARPDIWQTSSDYLRWFGYSRLCMVNTFVLSGFLRGQGNTKAPMVGNLIANISNCILNFLFIYETRELTVFGHSFTMWGAGKGVAGAAMATSCANALQTVYIFYVLMTSDLTVPFHFGKMEKPDRKLFRFSFSLGGPNALERFLNAYGRLLCTGLLAGISNEALSAHSLAETAESIIFMTVMGFSTTGTTLVSQWLGAGDEKRAKLLSTECLKMAFGVGLLSTSIVFVFCPRIISFFTDSEEVIRMASLALRIECVIEPFEAVALTLGGVLRGAGDVRVVTITSFLGMWCIRIMGAEVAVRCFDAGLLGVWIPMGLDWVLRFIILMIRYRRGKWMYVWDSPGRGKSKKA